jgi:hypothetical protein
METRADPDFLVTYYPIVKNRKVRTTVRSGWGWGYRPFHGGVGVATSSVRNYKEGTIVIEIVDFKTNQLIWQGAAAGASRASTTPRKPMRWCPRPCATSWPSSHRNSPRIKGGAVLPWRGTV